MFYVVNDYHHSAQPNAYFTNQPDKVYNLEQWDERRKFLEELGKRLATPNPPPPTPVQKVEQSRGPLVWAAISPTAATPVYRFCTSELAARDEAKRMAREHRCTTYVCRVAGKVTADVKYEAN